MWCRVRQSFRHIGQFLVLFPTFRDVLQSKEAHPGVPVHRPLLGLTVRLAAVIHEAGLVPLGPGIDDPVLTTPETQTWFSTSPLAWASGLWLIKGKTIPSAYRWTLPTLSSVSM